MSLSLFSLFFLSINTVIYVTHQVQAYIVPITLKLGVSFLQSVD